MDSPEKSMPVTISSTDAQRQFGQVVRRTFSGREHFIVERDGLPVMVIISMSEYAQLMEQRERDQDRQDRLREFREATRAMGEDVEAQGLTEEDTEAKVEEVRQRLFEERHGNRPTK